MRNLAGRLSWKHASVVIALATVVPPYTTFLYGFGGHDGHVSIATYALLWAIYPPESSMSGLQVLTYYALSTGLSLGFFNIIFAFQVIRFTRGATSKRNTLLVGALTLVLPITSLIVAFPTMISSGAFVYIGPIPIQLITGLLLMHLAGPKEPVSPW
ncbi:MAG: hypothetical protein C4K48_10470 [Candidatus Thorarchaeota archaeon]|nr:MAG: hypothetical protein C4K48_10470 [Candidatus Thorarchaeota archaeon]